MAGVLGLPEGLVGFCSIQGAQRSHIVAHLPALAALSVSSPGGVSLALACPYVTPGSWGSKDLWPHMTNASLRWPDPGQTRRAGVQVATNLG